MTTDQKLIRNKLGLLDLASYLKNVSEACRVMGYSRDTFYRVKNAYEEGGMEALIEKSRKRQLNRILTMGYYSGSRVFCFC
ncbi:MAG: helix-turn-helix domain-containing protein [Peptococcia bacterium]